MLKDKKYHILVIPSWYPTDNNDVKGSFFREQALALKCDGHNVGVIAPQFRSLKKIKNIFLGAYGYEKEIDNGMPTLRWHAVNFFPKKKNSLRNRWIKIGLKLFNKYVAEYGKPDIIHVHSLINAGYLASIIKEKFDIPFIVTEHSTAFSRNLLTDQKLIELNRIVERSSSNLAVSKEFKNLLNNTFKFNNWVYIPNIVKKDFLEVEIMARNNEFKFINICFLDKKKRVDNLIQAFSQVVEKYPSIKLEIGGIGTEKDNLEKLVLNLNLENNIVFLGKLSRCEVIEKINDSSVFILSSDYETFGVVVVEALALGKPVIATKCGGPETIINSKVGMLVDKGSISQLSEAMIKIYESNNSYDPLEIRKYCKENFGEKAVISQLNTVYKSVLEA